MFSTNGADSAQARMAIADVMNTGPREVPIRRQRLLLEREYMHFMER